jgi:trk system potassium uptake protein TrkH
LLSDIEGETPSILFWRSMSFFDSVAVEIIIMVFMALSAVSFALYYVFYSHRHLAVFTDRELLVYLVILLTSTLFVWGILVFQGQYGDDWLQALRYSAFDVISVITTTGFITADFDQWDTAAKLGIFLLMFVGGCAGSTAGGIKLIRALVTTRTIGRDIYKSIHPQAILPLMLGRQIISEETRIAIPGLVLAWLAVFAVGSVLISL